MHLYFIYVNVQSVFFVFHFKKRFTDKGLRFGPSKAFSLQHCQQVPQKFEKHFQHIRHSRNNGMRLVMCPATNTTTCKRSGSVSIMSFSTISIFTSLFKITIWKSTFVRRKRWLKRLRSCLKLRSSMTWKFWLKSFSLPELNTKGQVC